MNTVSEILKIKGNDIWSIGSDASVYEAIELMADKEIGVLLVMDDSKLTGIISERDYTRKVILKGHSSRDIKIKEIMTEGIYCVRPEQSLEECMALMTEKRIRHLPVMGDEQKMLGVISIGDLVKSTIAEQQFIIERLAYYARTSGKIHRWVSKMADKSMQPTSR